jgi:hypothetical protein
MNNQTKEHVMRKYWIAFSAALTLAAVPTAAFAANPSHPVHPTTPATTGVKGATSDIDATHPVVTPTVMYVLRGTLTSYTAASTTTTGSVSITVKSSNFEQKTLKTMTLTFVVNSKTNVVLHNDKAFAIGDRGIVKVRAPKKSDATTLQTKTAFEVIDQR